VENQALVQLKQGDPTTIEFMQTGLLGIVAEAPLAGITGIDVVIASGGVAQPTTAELTVNEGNGLVGKSAPLPIQFNGVPSLDTLIVEGTATGTVTETLTQGSGQGAGVLDITNGTASSTISLTGVARIIDTMTAATLTINTLASGANNFVQVRNGPIVNNFQTDTVELRNITTVSTAMDDNDLGTISFPDVDLGDALYSFGFGTLESVNFANKSNVVINGNGENNFSVVAVTTAAAGFQSLTLNGAAGLNVAAIRSLPAGVTPSLSNIQVQAPGSQAVFIEEIYEERLGRLANEAELVAWLTVFQASGQTAVATGIEQSLEARTDLVDEFYQRYLGRGAVNGEAQHWVQLLMQGETDEQVIAGIVSSSEFYARSQTLVGSGTPDQRYVQALYQLLLNRFPAVSELNSWVGQLPALGRSGVALGFLGSSEFRTAAVTDYYVEFLQRLPDAPGLAGWLASGLSLEQIRVGLESSGEFLADG